MRCAFFIAFFSSFWSALADEGTLTTSVQAEPVFLRVIGTFDPKIHDLFFISSLQSRFDNYCQLHFANLIFGFDLAAMFLNEKTQYDYKEQDAATSITSWCEIQSTFSLQRDTDIVSFSSNNASRLVMNFCSGSQIDQLRYELNQINNVTVTSINAFSARSEEVQSLLSDSSFPIPDASSGSEESKSLIALAYVSLAIILFALAALALSSLRRKYLIGNIKSDNSSDIPRAPSADDFIIKRAIGQDADCDNGSHASTSNQTHHNDLESFMVFSNCETSVSPSEIENDESAIGDDPSGRRDLYASETFDDDESGTSRTDVHPDYQCNSSLPSNSVSPAWSMDSFSQNTSPYSAHAEGLSKRRRWHDEVNEINFLSLPESLSTCSSTFHSSSGTSKS